MLSSVVALNSVEFILGNIFQQSAANECLGIGTDWTLLELTKQQACVSVSIGVIWFVGEKERIFAVP